MMRTLTHDAVLAAFVVGIPFLAIVTAAIVAITLAIKSRRDRSASPVALGVTGPGVVSMRLATPGPALAALTPDSPVLPVDLTSEWWRSNPTEPLAPSEVVRWKDITEKYEWVAVPVVVPGRES